ncbi:hypothetical protein HMPREF0454_04429 [Hafnia alvei ATCC 51873]|uniref:Uncharacterized protein n=1 Tax=Hafnia alvei ATCC 51873 TaxID=1002364 RepID=G9YCV1_HAFAL|nr:hypothetical protein HMPREF0454_04429 [Hafnia alvei ATCC 51873]
MRRASQGDLSKICDQLHFHLCCIAKTGIALAFMRRCPPRQVFTLAVID